MLEYKVSIYIYIYIYVVRKCARDIIELLRDQDKLFQLRYPDYNKDQMIIHGLHQGKTYFIIYIYIYITREPFCGSRE